MDKKISSLRITQDLISFNSISHNSNLSLIYYVSDFLSSYNIQHNIQYNKTKQKANLLATIGPIDRNGIIFAAHTDVVPVEEQLWEQDPFKAWIRDNRLYGRGAADMKSFIAVILSLIPHMLCLNLTTPVHIFLTFDEEVGCHGARKVIDKFKEMHLPNPIACIVGEPTEMRVINAHKGVHLLNTTVIGKAGHSSDPRAGSNALNIMSKIVIFLEKIANKYKKNYLYYDHSFDIPYNTINTGILRGGTAINIIPEKAELIWEYRFLPEAGLPNILDRLKSYSRKIQKENQRNKKHCSIITEEIALVPPLKSSGNKAFTDYMLHMTGNNQASKVNFGTEAGLYQTYLNTSTIICGPGSINQAHKPNEYIEISQIYLAEQTFKKVIERINSTNNFSL